MTDVRKLAPILYLCCLYPRISQLSAQITRLHTGHVLLLAAMSTAKCIQGFRWGNLKGRPTGGRRRRWEDNIKMALHEIGREGVQWTDLAKDNNGGHLKIW